MSDDVSKLPDFPLHASDEFTDMEFKAHALTLERDAYRARMEVLVEHINEKAGMSHRADCALYLHSGALGIRCDCGLDALLAACERKEADK